MIDTDPGTLARVLWHGRKITAALRSGDLRIEGDRSAARRFLALFPAPTPAPPPLRPGAGHRARVATRPTRPGCALRPSRNREYASCAASICRRAWATTHRRVERSTAITVHPVPSSSLRSTSRVAPSC